MDFESKKRKLASPNPWQRDPKEASITFDDMNYLMNHALKRPKFAALLVKHNICLDMYF
uniref:Uncharacterized protein n=1 Tax=Manihot esculenta TaxID=3983 RepID=A0A199UAF3_MANES